MKFLIPGYLHLAWLALIPLALYLFRKQAKRIPVSTLLFFRSLSREHQESAWLRRLKRILSLLLTLLVLWLAVLALARPTGEAAADTPGAVVVLVDRSASMAAERDGQSRLDVAKGELRERLRALPSQVVVSLVAMDAKAHVLLSRSANRRECLRLLEEMQPRPMEGRPDLARAAVARLAELDDNAAIWHSGDAPLEWPEGDALAERYGFLNVALNRPVNVGITGFQIRPAPLERDRYECFVQLSAAEANDGPLVASLEVTLAGRLAQLREVELEPGATASLVLPLEGLRGQELRLQLDAAGDCLGWDNAVVVPLPEVKPLLVAWFAKDTDPFTELAMTSLIEAGRIEMLRGDPSAWPMENEPDVYVFEHWLPQEWPTERPVIALEPQESAGPIRVRVLPKGGLPHEGIRTLSPEHPVLFRVTGSRVALTQSVVLDVPDTLEPLWMAGNEPILLAGESEGQRLVVTAFSPSRSEQLALLPALPLVLGNALYWCAESVAQTQRLQATRPGDVIPATGLVEWTEWDGVSFIKSSQEATLGWLEIDRLGAWSAGEGRLGVAVLASLGETDVPSAERIVDDKASGTPAQIQSLRVRGSWANWPEILIGGVLFVLLLESYLFHRHAVF